MLIKNICTVMAIGSLAACSGGSSDTQQNITESLVSSEVITVVDTAVVSDADTTSDTDTTSGTDIASNTDSTDSIDNDTSNDNAQCVNEQYDIISAQSDVLYEGIHAPSLAIDGDFDDDSRWSSEGSNQEIIFDLGQEKDITALQMKWLKSDIRTTNFSVETSTDNSTWENVISTQNSALTANADDLDVVNLSETINAQYVKVIGHGNSDNSDWNSLIEIDIFKCELDESVISVVDNDSSPSTAQGDDNVATCDSVGQMLYNGTCSPYTEVYEEERGVLNDGDYLISSSPIEMTFDALAAQHVTPNGNGWRHELKVKSSGGYRVAMTDVYELFKAKITANLTNGSKTIVAQHHAETTATITKLYIADLDEGGFENAPDGRSSDSIALNGIFDVYIRLAKEDGSGETKHLLTTIRTGESFDFEEENDHGVITVKINGQSLDSISVADSSESFFKFGNYLQAQNPETGNKLASGNNDNDWADFYAQYFTESEITFTDMSYIRTVD